MQAHAISTRLKILLALGAAAIIVGCWKSGPAAPMGNQATQPVAVAPVQTQPAAELPPAALLVGNKECYFPPALLRLTVADGKVNARLMSNDPREALEPNYQGNSFDLKLPDIASAADWEKTHEGTWIYVSQSSEAQSEDSPHGIFLQGQARRLYPRAARFDFVGDASQVAVTIRGTFLMYENTSPADQSAAAPQVVSVQGRLNATVTP